MPESKWLFTLTERAFDAFAAGKAPDVVLLKSVYLLLKDEGYPVRESWWPTLRADLRETAKRQLQNQWQLEKMPSIDFKWIKLYERHLPRVQ